MAHSGVTTLLSVVVGLCEEVTHLHNGSYFIPHPISLPHAYWKVPISTSPSAQAWPDFALFRHSSGGRERNPLSLWYQSRHPGPRYPRTVLNRHLPTLCIVDSNFMRVHHWSFEGVLGVNYVRCTAFRLRERRHARARIPRLPYCKSY